MLNISYFWKLPSANHDTNFYYFHIQKQAEGEFVLFKLQLNNAFKSLHDNQFGSNAVAP